MEHHRHVQLFRRRPEGFQSGVGHVDIRGIAGQHGPQHAQGLHGILQLLCGPLAVLQGHRGDSAEGLAAVLARLRHMLVQQPYPVALLVGREGVALDIQPGGHVLGGHALLLHPLGTGLGIGQTTARGPQCGQMGEGQSMSGIGLGNTNTEGPMGFRHLFQEAGGGDVGVNVDKSGWVFLGHDSSRRG